MKEVFGEAGVGTRSAVGMGALARRDRRRDRGDLPGQGLMPDAGASARPFGEMPPMTRPAASGPDLPDRRRDQRDRPGHRPAVPREGARVVVCGRSSRRPTRRTRPARARSATGPRRSRADAADPDSVDCAVPAGPRRLLGGRLDVLFHVAGHQRPAVRRRPAARVHGRGLGRRPRRQRPRPVPDQPRGRPADARAAARRARPARDGPEHGLGARLVAVAGLLRHVSPTPPARGRSGR